MSALKAISDRQGPKVTTETRQVWLTEHSTTGSEVQPVEHMASVETSLIFNRDLIDRIVVKGPKALHRLALGLSAFALEETGWGRLTESDAKSFGVDLRGSVPFREALDRLRSAGLVDQVYGPDSDGLYKFQMLVAPVRSGPRSWRKQTTYTTAGRSLLQVPSARVPSDYFKTDMLNRLSDDEFHILMAIHALSDPAYGNAADPAHLSVRRGRLKVSDDLKECLFPRVGGVLEGITRLCSWGLVAAVPSDLESAEIPSSASVFRWLGESCNGDMFVFRPLHGWRPRKAVACTVASQFPPISSVGLEVRQVSEEKIHFRINRLITIPRPDDADTEKVVQDRIAMSRRSAVRKLTGSVARPERARVRYSIVSLDQLPLLHVAKHVTDALQDSSVLRSDSWVHLPEVLMERLTATSATDVLQIEIKDLDDKENALITVYGPLPEWRPQATRGDCRYSKGWSSVESYVASLEMALAGEPSLGVAVDGLRLEDYSLTVTVSSRKRCDLENVGLAVVDLLTLMRSDAFPADKLVSRIRLVHVSGPEHVDVELEKT